MVDYIPHYHLGKLLLIIAVCVLMCKKKSLVQNIVYIGFKSQISTSQS